MPRRCIPLTSLPYRPDRRRPGGNAIDAQRPARRGRAGEVERIAERRVRALELRKSDSSYRRIAEALAVDTHTAWPDVASELELIREKTVEQAQELRALEVERLDAMVSGLWPQIRAGSRPAVSAAVRVSERRSKLLGLDEPTARRTPMLIDASPSPAAAVDGVVSSELTEHSTASTDSDQREAADAETAPTDTP